MVKIIDFGNAAQVIVVHSTHNKRFKNAWSLNYSPGETKTIRHVSIPNKLYCVYALKTLRPESWKEEKVKSFFYSLPERVPLCVLRDKYQGKLVFCALYCLMSL